MACSASEGVVPDDARRQESGCWPSWCSAPSASSTWRAASSASPTGCSAADSPSMPPCPPRAVCSPAARSPTAASRSARSPRWTSPRKGLRVDLALKDGTKIPLDSKMYVHNLSAVGEQYLDFEPPDDKPPYAKAGDVIKGDESSLPMSEEVLLTQMNSMVTSVDSDDLSTVIGELGTMFRGTANPLQRMVDSGSQFVDAAAGEHRRHHHAARHRPDRAADPGRPREGHPDLRAGPGRPHRHAARPPTRTSARSSRAAPRRSARSTRCSRASSPPCRSSCPTWSPPTRC